MATSRDSNQSPAKPRPMKLARGNSQDSSLNPESPARILSQASSLVSRKATTLRANLVIRNPQNSPVNNLVGSLENRASNQVKTRASNRVNSPGRLRGNNPDRIPAVSLSSSPDNNLGNLVNPVSSRGRLPGSQVTILRASHPVHLNPDSSRGSDLNPVNEASRGFAVSLSQARSRRKVSRAAISPVRELR